MNCYVSAPGDVVDKVKIERENESTVVFTDGARHAYIGYITIKVQTCLCFVIVVTVMMYTKNESTVMFTDRARNAYIRYIPIEVQTCFCFCHVMTVVMYTKCNEHTHVNVDENHLNYTT